MELIKNYTPSDTEEKWNSHWISKGYFNSRPDGRPAFTVVIPPPNVTGVLHMGHTLNETVQARLVHSSMTADSKKRTEETRRQKKRMRRMNQ